MSEDDRKIFVGGLHPETTESDLSEYFGKFGGIRSCSLKFDQMTNRSRGFAFLVFEDKEGVNAALKEGPHTITGKQVEAKLANPQPKVKKVFVGGIDRQATAEDVKQAFQDKGYSVEDVFLPTDNDTGEGKGFSFVTLVDENAAGILVTDGHNKIVIKDKECDIKKAKSKNESQRGGFRGGRGGRGRGGYDMYGGGGYGGGGYGGGGYGGGGYGGGGYGGGFGGYDQGGWGGNSYGGHDQYKMKGGRGASGYHPY